MIRFPVNGYPKQNNSEERLKQLKEEATNKSSTCDNRKSTSSTNNTVNEKTSGVKHSDPSSQGSAHDKDKTSAIKNMAGIMEKTRDPRRMI